MQEASVQKHQKSGFGFYPRETFLLSQRSPSSSKGLPYLTIPKKGCEIGGEAIGIPGVVVVRVAVRVHIAEVVAVVVVRRTLPPIRSGQRESPKPTGFTEMHPIFLIW